MPQPSAETSVVMQNHPASITSEAYRSLRFNLDRSLEQGLKSIVVTSPGRKEGRTTTAVNLAAAYAQLGRKVVLVDADLRHPSLHAVFGQTGRKGLADFLSRPCEVSDIVIESPVENLSVVYAGAPPLHPTELLASGRMKELLAELGKNYDLIIADTSSVLPSTDSRVVAAQCDGVLLVIEFGKVKRSAAKRIASELEHAKVNLLGIVWNKIRKQEAKAYLYT
ncbi:CpsD/CapB family tyrosine-protein kinase [Paenibacillus sp. CC-CFT747]|nr:CpsD/CapB family tyrosine-protein kinase [Paenibacillus sp. CC-CFT747]